MTKTTGPRPGDERYSVSGRTPGPTDDYAGWMMFHQTGPLVPAGADARAGRPPGHPAEPRGDAPLERPDPGPGVDLLAQPHGRGGLQRPAQAQGSGGPLPRRRRGVRRRPDPAARRLRRRPGEGPAHEDTSGVLRGRRAAAPHQALAQREARRQPDAALRAAGELGLPPDRQLAPAADVGRALHRREGDAPVRPARHPARNARPAPGGVRPPDQGSWRIRRPQSGSRSRRAGPEPPRRPESDSEDRTPSRRTGPRRHGSGNRRSRRPGPHRPPSRHHAASGGR